MSKSFKPERPRAQNETGANPVEETPPPAPEDASGAAAPKRPAWLELLDLDRETAKDEQIADVVRRDVASVVTGNPLLEQYNLCLLLDSRAIGRSDADHIYRAVSGIDRSKPILLILRSPGRDIAAAYFVSKICRENTDAHFAVAVPREAKSAATLICCGADRIHMGGLSELGPIDPQFSGIPALALKHSVEHIAELASRFPAAAGILTDYLRHSLKIEALGYYERVAASAVQYAVRLLGSRKSIQQQPNEIEHIAERLVYAYKDHSFVIDAREAAEIFGDTVVAKNTPEYDLANSLYSRIDFLAFVLAGVHNRHLEYAGNLESGCLLAKRQPSG